METQYCHLLQVDEYGERITSKQQDYSRCVSIECIEGITPTGDEEEEGSVITPSQPLKSDTPLPNPIPVEELQNVYYFQWRVDRLDEGEKTPKIYIGICRESLEI